MNDIKVGDWVVFIPRFGCNDLVEVIGFEEYPAQKWVHFKFFNGDIDRKPIEDIRPATPTEKAAGQRIDTPPNATTASPCHDPSKDGKTTVQEGEKAAIVQGFATDWPVIHKSGFERGWMGVATCAYEMAWQRQQVIINMLTAALDIKEQLNQKLREREEEQKKQIAAVRTIMAEYRKNSVDVMTSMAFDEIDEVIGVGHANVT